MVCFTSTETIRTVRDGEPKTATTSTETIRTVRDGETSEVQLDSTETLGLSRTGAQDGHLGFHSSSWALLILNLFYQRINVSRFGLAVRR